MLENQESRAGVFSTFFFLLFPWFSHLFLPQNPGVRTWLRQVLALPMQIFSLKRLRAKGAAWAKLITDAVHKGGPGGPNSPR